jgi:putative peptidoglycan lipid II flippase
VNRIATRRSSKPPPRTTLLRQSGQTGAAAVLSLVSALAFDLSIAYTYGAGAATDAYFGGARIPIATAAVALVVANQALVPTFGTWFLRRGEAGGARLAGEMLTVIFLVTGLVAAALAAAAPAVVAVVAPGFDSGTRDTAVAVLRVSAMTVPLSAVAEAIRAYLNARYAFLAPALVNVVLNGVAVTVVLLGDGPVVLVAWATVVGNTARVAVLLVMAARHGLLPRLPRLRGPDRELAGALRRMGRPLVTGGLPPVARLGEVVILSFLPAGALSLLSYATRLVSGVGGSVFLRSISVALVPRMTEAAAAGDVPRQRRTVLRGRLLMLLVSLPLTALIVAGAVPVSRLLFMRGGFRPDDVLLLSAVLGVLALSLPADAVGRAYLSPFFARLDTRTPLRNALLGVAVNLVLLAGFVLPLTLVLPGSGQREAVLGAAAAIVLAQVVQSLHAASRARALLGRLPFEGHRTGLSVLAAACAATATGGVLLGGWTTGGSTPAARGATVVAVSILVLTTGAAIAWRHGLQAALAEHRKELA